MLAAAWYHPHTDHTLIVSREHLITGLTVSTPTACLAGHWSCHGTLYCSQQLVSSATSQDVKLWSDGQVGRWWCSDGGMMCSRAILVIIDPILLLRKHRAGGHETLAHCGASGL